MKPFERLKQLYHDATRAIHARVAHTRGCVLCRDHACCLAGAQAHADEQVARRAYDDGLRAAFG